MYDVTVPSPVPADSSAVRKGRGAFFTPVELCRYIVDWAIRSPDDHVLEPSCGEAAFLLTAVGRLADLARPTGAASALGRVLGVELHERSARQALGVVRGAGHNAEIQVADFFTIAPRPVFDAVVGNPPYVRYQDFAGESRARSREAALRGGVALTSLASSWAAFTVHAALFLKPGGRLGLVLPAELLTVNYAAPVRRFLMERFANVRVVVFTERVFPGVLEEVVLVMADGFNRGPANACQVFQARDAGHLWQAPERVWRPATSEGKWTPSLVPAAALAVYEQLIAGGAFTTLHDWGETTLGMVTGNNRYFALSPVLARQHGIDSSELLRLSPPGSRHLRRLAFDEPAWWELGRHGRATYLFRPADRPSRAAMAYIAAGEAMGVDGAYKCRVRSPWWRVPLVAPADLLLTYMNADTPRLTANSARVHHLNSVHGVYLHPGVTRADRDLLPVAALNSMTLLGAETVGRGYGGGILKIEPKEADLLPVPSREVLGAARDGMTAVAPRVGRALRDGSVIDAAKIVDEMILVRRLGMDRADVRALSDARAQLHARRVARGGRPRDHA